MIEIDLKPTSTCPEVQALYDADFDEQQIQALGGFVVLCMNRGVTAYDTATTVTDTVNTTAYTAYTTTFADQFRRYLGNDR